MNSLSCCFKATQSPEASPYPNGNPPPYEYESRKDSVARSDKFPGSHFQYSATGQDSATGQEYTRILDSSLLSREAQALPPQGNRLQSSQHSSEAINTLHCKKTSGQKAKDGCILDCPDAENRFESIYNTVKKSESYYDAVKNNHRAVKALRILLFHYWSFEEHKKHDDRLLALGESLEKHVYKLSEEVFVKWKSSQTLFVDQFMYCDLLTEHEKAFEVFKVLMRTCDFDFAKMKV